MKESNENFFIIIEIIITRYFTITQLESLYVILCLVFNQVAQIVVFMCNGSTRVVTNFHRGRRFVVLGQIFGTKCVVIRQLRRPRAGIWHRFFLRRRVKLIPIFLLNPCLKKKSDVTSKLNAHNHCKLEKIENLHGEPILRVDLYFTIVG